MQTNRIRGEEIQGRVKSSDSGQWHRLARGRRYVGTRQLGTSLYLNVLANLEQAV